MIKNESTAAKQVICDACSDVIGESYASKKGSLTLPLPAPDTGIYQDSHFCNEDCLRNHLNARAKASSRKKAKSSIEIVGNSVELDISSDARYISTKQRNDMKDSDFLDPERRSFPIKNCEDVKAAVHAWGRYKGSMSFDEFKAKLTRKAHELGCSLPDKWDEGKK